MEPGLIQGDRSLPGLGVELAGSGNADARALGNHAEADGADEGHGPRQHLFQVVWVRVYPEALEGLAGVQDGQLHVVQVRAENLSLALVPPVAEWPVHVEGRGFDL